MGELTPNLWAALGGLIVGVVFGAAVQLSNFCAMGGISDQVLMGNGNRLRAWFLAVAVAIAGAQTAQWLGLVDLSKSIYQAPSLGWVGAIAGGLLFGFGMTRTSGCATRNIVRAGSGSLKSLVVVLIVAIVGDMTLRGLLGPLRQQIDTTNLRLDAVGIPSQHMGDILSATAGISPEIARGAIAAVAILGIAWWCFKDREFRASPRNMLGGLFVGLCVAAGWLVTGVLGADDFEPAALASFTFVAPVSDSLQYLMTWTGTSADFAVGSIGGTILGSFLAALLAGRFRIEGFADKDDTVRHVYGSALMGFGGVLALGCTIGQGTTGMSTLAAGSLIALASILVGGWFGVKHLEEGTVGGALRGMLVRA